jgi:hypothetical protein
MDSSLVASGYADHLTDADLALLASAAGPRMTAATAAQVRRLRADPQAAVALLGDPHVFEAVFGPGRGAAPGGPVQPVAASPFLAFTVAVHRAAAELASVEHVPERSGVRQRVPLFDAPGLRDFLGSPARRLFLAELLASFTRVASGSYRERGGGRARARRFSELDPVSLAALASEASETDRPGMYRRLGDVALFLTGVFPDYAAARAFGPVNLARLLDATRVPARDHERLAAATGIELLEHLGGLWYRAACAMAPVRTARLAVVAEVAGRFRQARRVLNHIADHYLLPPGGAWFSPPPG